MPNVVLESLLKPLEEFYTPSFVEEIAINNEKNVWLRLNKSKVPWVQYKAPILSKQYLIDLIHTVANIYKKPFDPVLGVPVVYATLPGNHRFTAIAGGNVLYDENDITGGVALNIRNSGVKNTSFKNYHLEKGKKLLNIKPRVKKFADDPYEKLMQCINDGSPILISGATSTGKTTFLNHILTMIDKNQRIITVEDAREVNVPHLNRIHFLLSRTEQSNKFTYNDLFNLIVRLTPDIIIGGEISKYNASILWDMMRTGHDHFYTTIHASSANEAYEMFVTHILATNNSYKSDELLKELKQKLRVVQLSRDGGTRAVTEIV